MTTVLTSETAEQLQLLSEEQRVRAESILLLIRYAIFALALPAIVCNVVVFAQREMRGAISVYVIGLSVGRLVYTVVSVVGTVVREAVDVDDGDSYACYLLYRSVTDLSVCVGMCVGGVGVGVARACVCVWGGVASMCVCERVYVCVWGGGCSVWGGGGE